MNSDLGIKEPSPVHRASSRTNALLPRNRTKTISNAPGGARAELAHVVEGRNGAVREVLLAPPPAVLPRKVHESEAPHVQRLNARQVAFRCVRLTMAGALVSCAVVYTRTALTSARSEQAYINAEITALRAPISGQVRLQPIAAGRMLPAGTVLFSIENARVGNEQALSQLNWVTELAQRLRAEAEEATVRFGRQEEVTKVHEKMYADQIIPRLELIEEQSKLAMAGTIMTNKLTLAKKAEERAAELLRLAELQQKATVTMPFDGAAWAISAKDGAQLATYETVLEVINPKRIWVDAIFHERHVEKLAVGSEVDVQTSARQIVCRGTVESVRGGVGRIPFEGIAGVRFGESTQGRIAVRVRLDIENPFAASQFFGVGRSVVVTAGNHE